MAVVRWTIVQLALAAWVGALLGVAMVNLFSLLFSTIMVVYVVVKAAVLDVRLPWFGPLPTPGPVPDSDKPRRFASTPPKQRRAFRQK